MARAEDVRELAAMLPWLRADFQADLVGLTESVAESARRFAVDVQRLARLAAMVPRCANDDVGGTPWTSFRREVAVARSCSDQAAARDVRVAQRLTSCLPQTFELLEAGRISEQRVRAFVAELEAFDDALAAELDELLAEQVAALPVRRIVELVRKSALELDPDAVAARVAAKTAGRSVELFPAADDQASVVLCGLAVPLTRWFGTLDSRARALRQAGDGRTLDALRFDLATSTFPCASHAPAAPAGLAAQGGAMGATGKACGPARAAATGASGDGPEGRDGHFDPDATWRLTDADLAAAGLRLSGVEPAPEDCRRSRPVQAHITVPVETALGLSSTPGWLEGYGWLSAPASRLLLVDAELRRLCVQTGTGQLVDLADRDVRPPPTPDGVRQALLDMICGEVTLTDDVGWRTEPDHDPTDRLRDYVTARDRACDGPTGRATPARRCELDHDTPHPTGPTAAWNLTARATRTHQLKHAGWTPLRTPTGTTWLSPAGQVIDVPRHTSRPPGVDPDPSSHGLALPDPAALHATDRLQLTPAGPDDHPPWLPAPERPEPTEWTWLSTTETGATAGAAPNSRVSPTEGDSDDPPF